MNCGLRSKTAFRVAIISEDMVKLYSGETFSTVCRAVGTECFNKISLQAFEKRSTTSRIQVWFSDTGNVRNSTPKWDHGRLGTGSGRSLLNAGVASAK